MGLVSFETNVSETAGQLHLSDIMCDVRGIAIGSIMCDVRCIKRVYKSNETQGAFGVLNANAKSQTRKSMMINVICTVVWELM